MPLLEISQSRYLTATIRLEETTAAQIDQYAAFLHASADDVVDKALSYVFSKDREFQEYLKLANAARIPSSLRIRRSPQNGVASEAAMQSTKPAKALESAHDLRPRS